MSGNRESRIDLLRHGACEGGEIYRGSTDVPLSTQGVEQMRTAAARVPDWEAVVSSPLRRCREFAGELAAERGLPLTVDDGFREMDFGEWEGRLVQAVWDEDRERARQFYADPLNNTPPGGERVYDAQARAVAAWQSQLAEHAGKRFVLVCHGGIIRLLLCHFLEMPLSAIARVQVPYAALTRLQVYHRDEGDFPVVVSMNALETLS